MAGNRWCNVHREDDKVTKWIFEKWLRNNLDAYSSLPIALCIARLVNWPDTLEKLEYPHKGWTPTYRNHWLSTFATLRGQDRKAWTGAYMVTGGYSKGGETKETIIARVLDGASETTTWFLNHRPETLEEAAGMLTTPGMGTFLTAQVIADLKNTALLRSAGDWWTWCAPGPGSTMGLNFIFDRPRTRSWSELEFQDTVNFIRHLIGAETGIDLCAQNTQNCLCEFSKYVRAKHFGERLKTTYSPRAGV